MYGGFFFSLSNKSPLIISKAFNERLEGVLSTKRGLRVIFIAHASLLCGGGSALLLPKGPKVGRGEVGLGHTALGDVGLRLTRRRVPVGREEDTV